jgi:hypothetical protein
MNQTYWEFLKSISAIEIIIAILGVGSFVFLFCTWAHWEGQNGFPTFERVARFMARPIMRFAFLVPMLFVFLFSLLRRKA